MQEPQPAPDSTQDDQTSQGNSSDSLVPVAASSEPSALPESARTSGSFSMLSIATADVFEYVLNSKLGSVGEETCSEPDLGGFEDEDEEFGVIPELTMESIHKFIASERHLTLSGVPKLKVLLQISGTGLAPWEVHRPQKFVRDLVARRCFSGRVLDAGCGIGDNALYVAKACPEAEVVAVDLVPRCLEFASAKAKIRGLRGRLVLAVGDLLEQDPERMAEPLGPGQEGSYSAVLDSSTFHNFEDAERAPYVATLRRLLRPGGRVYMNCMSEEETQPGGPRRVTVPELLSLFNRPGGWEVESIEESVVELHPAFWGGRGRARLYAIRKL